MCDMTHQMCDMTHNMCDLTNKTPAIQTDIHEDMYFFLQKKKYSIIWCLYNELTESVCCTLQHTMQHTLQHTTTHRNTLQPTATHNAPMGVPRS